MASNAFRRLAAGSARLSGPLARTGLGRVIGADRRWLLPLFIVAYVLYVTWRWEFPNNQGIPFPPVWIGASLGGLAIWHGSGRRLGSIAVTAILAVAAMVLTDVTLFWSQPLRDFTLYVKAGEAWLFDAPVYHRVPLVEAPADLSNYPFLYPPITLPLFGALALIPFPVAASLWIGISVVALMAGLRWIGFGWRWCLVLLAWPPVAQGLYVGNVAVPLFALFAGAVWRPALLVIPPIFKIYSGIAALWLLRREHWRDLIAGAVAVGSVGLVTLALTGTGLWLEWIEALLVYQQSQRLLPHLLYGFGLGRYVPLVALIVLGAVLAFLAFRTHDHREQLSRLGVATVAASPSLFAHGWLVAAPAMARLDTPWFWLAFGLTACSPGTAWFLVLVLVVVSWFRPELHKGSGDDPWHPLGPAPEPWPVDGSRLTPPARPAYPNER